jgi:hypothetical protein
MKQTKQTIAPNGVLKRGSPGPRPNRYPLVSRVTVTCAASGPAVWFLAHARRVVIGGNCLDYF